MLCGDELKYKIVSKNQINFKFKTLTFLHNFFIKKFVENRAR